MITDEEIFQYTPYDDRRCMRCGKHISELKPFGEGIYALATVAKTYRNIDFVPYNEEYELILQTLYEFGDSHEMQEAIGMDKYKSAISYEGMRGCTERSWECRDCIIQEGAFIHFSMNKKQKN